MTTQPIAPILARTRRPVNTEAAFFGFHLGTLQSIFLQQRKLEPADLYNPPFDSFGQEAVDRWFSPAERAEMLDFVERLTV